MFSYVYLNMIENKEDKLFQIRLSNVGAHFIKKNTRFVKWLFGFSILGFLTMLAFNLSQLFSFNRQNASGISSDHSLLYVFYLNLLPILSLLQLVAFLFGALNYLKFAKQIGGAITEIDETSFNEAFKWLARASLIWIFQTVIAITNYGLVMIFFFIKKVTHN